MKLFSKEIKKERVEDEYSKVGKYRILYERNAS